MHKIGISNMTHLGREQCMFFKFTCVPSGVCIDSSYYKLFQLGNFKFWKHFLPSRANGSLLFEGRNQKGYKIHVAFFITK